MSDFLNEIENDAKEHESKKRKPKQPKIDKTDGNIVAAVKLADTQDPEEFINKFIDGLTKVIETAADEDEREYEMGVRLNTTFNRLLTADGDYDFDKAIRYEKDSKLEFLDFNIINNKKVYSVKEIVEKAIGKPNFNEYFVNCTIDKFKSQLVNDPVLDAVNATHALVLTNYTDAVDTDVTPVIFYRKNETYKSSKIGLIYISPDDKLKLYIPRYCNINGTNDLFDSLKACDIKDKAVLNLFLDRVYSLCPLYLLAFSTIDSEYCIKNLGKFTKVKSYADAKVSDWGGMKYLQIGTLTLHRSKITKKFVTNFINTKQRSLDVYICVDTHFHTDFVVNILRNINYNKVYNTAKLETAQFADNSVILCINM